MRPRTALFWSIVCLSIVLALIACSSVPANAPTSPPAGLSATRSQTTALPAQSEFGPIESMPSDAATPITVKLVLSHAPHLNETTYLTFTISSITDAPGTTAEIILPQGAELLTGSPRWSGDLAANQTYVMLASVKFTAEGNQEIEGKALREVGNGDVWGDAAQIYLHITAEAGYRGFATEPPTMGEPEKPTPPSVSPAPN